MTGEYPIYLNNEIVGQAHVERQGLYYRIVCDCSFPKTDIHKIQLICENRELDLGVCVPMGCRFGLQTRIPVKRIGDGTPIFRVTEKETKPDGVFVPFDTNAPFSYMARLRNAYWEKRGNIVGIVLTDPFPALQDNDPSQIHPDKSVP